MPSECKRHWRPWRHDERRAARAEACRTPEPQLEGELPAVCLGCAGLEYSRRAMGRLCAGQRGGCGVREPLAAVQRGRRSAGAAHRDDHRVHAPGHQRVGARVSGGAGGMGLARVPERQQGAQVRAARSCVHPDRGTARGGAGAAALCRQERLHRQGLLSRRPPGEYSDTAGDDRARGVVCGAAPAHREPKGRGRSGWRCRW